MEQAVKERIQSLLANSPQKIKTNRDLTKEFVELHLLTGGKKQDCFGCSFNNTYNRMKNLLKVNSNIYTQNVMSNNTFELKDPKFRAYMKFKSEVFNVNSSDELAIFWINQFDEYKEDRLSKFKVLPKALIEDVEVVAVEEVKEGTTTEEKPKKKRKRIAKS